MRGRDQQRRTSLPAWIPLRLPRDSWWTLALVAVLGFTVDATLTGLTGDTRMGATVPTWAVALLTLPAFIAAFWRYEFPWPVYALGLIQATLLTSLIPDYQPIAAPLVGLHAIVRQRPTREVVIALVLLLVPSTITTVVSVLGWASAEPWLNVVTAMLLYAAVTFMVVVLGHSQRQARELRATRERTYEAFVQVRVQEERLRLARNLHDKVANSIAAVIMGLDGMRRLHPDTPPSMGHGLELAEASARLAMKETREILNVLQANDEDETSGAALEDLDSTLRQMQTLGWADVEVDVLSIGESIELSPEIDECATRCVREAVTNAAKYGVSQVAIEVDWREDPFTITFQNVRGRDRLPDRSLRGGIGLGSILLHVTGVGGNVTLSTNEEIFTLVLTIPRR